MAAGVFLLSACATRLPIPGTAPDRPVATDGMRRLVFAFFRRDEPGLFLATSANGYAWQPVNGDKPVHTFKGTFRDPSIARGPDGRFQLVWTTGQPRRIGHASSPDLLRWTGSRSLPLMLDEPGCRNCWAPEIVRDGDAWLVHWSSTVDGAFERSAGDTDGNHRIYATRSKDFTTFEPAFVLFDPGFSVIDSSIIRTEDGALLFFKDERLDPSPRKRIHLTRGPGVTGPWGPISEPLSEQWVEGPSPIRLDDGWLVLHDFYVFWHNHYGAMFSRDLRSWRDVTPRIVLPPNARHGCVIEVDQATFDRLLSLSPLATAR